MHTLMKFIGYFVPSNKNTWFCFPHYGFSKQDLLNYTHDNIYSFLNHIINMYHEDEKLKIYLVCFNDYRKEDICTFMKSNQKIDFELVKDYSRWQSGKFGILRKFVLRIIYYRSFYSSKLIITWNPFRGFPMKLKKQTNICISYYNNATKNDFNNYIVKFDKIDYIITSADISSKIDAVATRIPYLNYRIFGLPKEDSIINPRFTRKEVFKKLNLDDEIEKIILYCPTHKDYERGTNKQRDILGYDGDYCSLNTILKNNRTQLLIKLHIGTSLNIICDNNGLSNIKSYEDSYEYTLYDIIPYADMLITDYSTIAFDFMLTRKPIIYNFYDYDVYHKTRGFSYDPFELVCAGPIVKTKNELEIAIEDYLANRDNPYKEKYEWIRQLTHKYDDGKAIERIYQFIRQWMLND